MKAWSTAYIDATLIV